LGSGAWASLESTTPRSLRKPESLLSGTRLRPVSPSSTLQMPTGHTPTRSCLERELGIRIVPYSPLARGFFAGRAAVESVPSESLLSKHPRYTGENLEKNKVLYTRLEMLSKKYGCSPAQLALSWVLHQGEDVVAIPGTTKVKNLDDNIGAVKVKLSKENLEEISAAVPAGVVAGSRLLGVLEPYSWRLANTPLPK